MESFNTYYLKCLRSVYNESTLLGQRSAKDSMLNLTFVSIRMRWFLSEKLALTSFPSFDSFLRQENF